MKTCSQCKNTKALSEFFNYKNMHDGKSTKCKICIYETRQKPKPPLLPIGHKRCNGCKNIKPYEQFFKDSANKTDGRYSHCIECKNKSTMEWRSNNKDYYNSYMRDKNKAAYAEARFVRYGVTKEWYDNQLMIQDHKCAIPGCNRTATDKRTMAVDHNHTTGKVRGLLCYKCNRDMHVIDNSEQMQKLLDYKKKYD